MSNDKEDVKRLYSILATINSEEDVEIFLGDLCTYKEIESMAQRIKSFAQTIPGVRRSVTKMQSRILLRVVPTASAESTMLKQSLT